MLGIDTEGFWIINSNDIDRNAKIVGKMRGKNQDLDSKIEKYLDRVDWTLL